MAPTIQQENDRATREYPSVVVGDCRLHVFEQGGDWHIWLNTEIADFDGLCLSVGASRADASAAAIATLEQALVELRRPFARCANSSPAWFTGRWRDWHRGHGCPLDDGKPRTPDGAAEIARGV